MKSKKGFSLVNLLVVLVILAVLLVITTSVLRAYVHRSEIRKQLGLDYLNASLLEDSVVQEMAKPQVAARLDSLSRGCESAKAREVTLSKPTPTDKPETLKANLEAWQKAKQETKAACQFFADATEYAKSHKFK